MPKSPAQRVVPHLALLTALLLGYFGITSHWLNKPFIGHHDWDNVLYALTARNYLRYGYLEYGAIQFYNLFPVESEAELSVYRSNPPTLAILQSLSVRAFGFHEMFIRLTTVFLSLISIAVFYQLARHLMSRRAALLAAFFFAFSMQVIYFARTPNFESGNVVLANAFLLAFVRWRRLGSPRRWGLAAGLAFAGLWYGHFMAFVLVALFGWALLRSTRREMLAIFGLGCAGLLGLATWMTYNTEFFDAQVIDELVDLWTYRTSDSRIERADTFTLVDYLRVNGFRLIYSTSPFVLLLAAWGVYRQSRGPRRAEVAIPWVLVVAGLLYTSLFRNATYLHDYFLYYFVPPLALWAGHGFTQVWPHPGWLPRNRPQRFAGAGLMGHFFLVLGVIYILVYRLNNESFLWLAENIAEQTAQTEQVASNLPYLGPNVSYYAYRNLTYEQPYTANDLERLLLQEGFALFWLCDAPTPPDLPPTLTVQAVGPCYAIRAAPSPP
ncbi:MAG: hypothetical protein HC915_10500 [Anaerolineae bacterium]|nr:hypothetical protein [Anaerolineae bacterium]